MKKVWIFNHYAYTPYNGSITRTYDMAGGLIAAGYDVTIFTSSWLHNTGKNEIEDGRPCEERNVDGRRYVYIKTRPYEGNGVARVINMLDFYRGLLHISKKYPRPDIVYASSPDLVVLRAGLKAAKREGAACVCEIRDLWPLSLVDYSGLKESSPIVWLLYGMEKRIYQKAAALVFTMPGGKDYIAQKGWDVDPEKIHYLNNGVDLERFSANQAQNVFFEQWLDDPDLFTLVYTGSVRRANDVMFLARWAQAAAETGLENVRFLIFGSGNEAPVVREYCEKNNLHNIRLYEQVDKKYIPSILMRADAGILHSRRARLLQYGISHNKLYEYMAAGLPVISTIDPNYSLVKEYGMGFELERQDTTCAVDATRKLCALSGEERTQIKENASRGAQAYSIDKLSSELVKILDGVIGAVKNYLSRRRSLP
jgi:glycosyltransferase involved in cell wall biosynthesis